MIAPTATSDRVCSPSTPEPTPPPPTIACNEGLSGKGQDYRGCQTTTKNGKTCQAWSSDSPHSHSNHPADKPNAGLESNYCRNPDGSETIWCYTTDIQTRWDYCDPITTPAPTTNPTTAPYPLNTTVPTDISTVVAFNKMTYNVCEGEHVSVQLGNQGRNVVEVSVALCDDAKLQNGTSPELIPSQSVFTEVASSALGASENEFRYFTSSGLDHCDHMKWYFATTCTRSPEPPMKPIHYAYFDMKYGDWNYRNPTATLSNNPHDPTDLGNSAEWTCDDTSLTLANVRLKTMSRGSMGLLTFYIPDNFDSTGMQIALYENAGTDTALGLTGDTGTTMHWISLSPYNPETLNQDVPDAQEMAFRQLNSSRIAESDSMGNEYIIVDRRLPVGHYMIQIYGGSTRDDKDVYNWGHGPLDSMETDNGRPLKQGGIRTYDVTFSLEMTPPKCNQQPAMCTQKYCDDTKPEWVYDWVYDSWGSPIDAVYVNTTGRNGTGSVLTIGDFPECCVLSYEDPRSRSCGQQVFSICPNTYMYDATQISNAPDNYSSPEYKRFCCSKREWYTYTGSGGSPVRPVSSGGGYKNEWHSSAPTTPAPETPTVDEGCTGCDSICAIEYNCTSARTLYTQNCCDNGTLPTERIHCHRGTALTTCHELQVSYFDANCSCSHYNV